MNIGKYLAIIAIALINGTASSQDTQKLISITVPQELTRNANAVVRQNDVLVTVENIGLATVQKSRIITVYNKLGMDDVAAFQQYSKTAKIKDLRAVVYDALGNELKVIKERDFRDVSAVDGGTLYDDDRLKLMEYTPRSYPVTIHFTAEVDYKSTAFLPQWWPLEGFYCSTESSSFKVVNHTDIEIKFKEQFIDKYPIKRVDNLHYIASNIPAQVNEAYSPDFKSFAPGVKLAMTSFEMEGVVGSNKSWSDFGKWMYDKLLQGTGDLPDEVKKEVQQITATAGSAKEKAQIIYQYVQDRSRYISVQVGIGGWKPIDATDVHTMAYGDCKGLTNYTMSLLKEVGITSHYAAIYGGQEKKSMDADFSMTEGNHVILYVPDLENDQDYWLECTSKNAPFGYMSDFTDDRDALVITPEGGQLIHTTSYPTSENTQHTKGDFVIDKEGRILGNVSIRSLGIQYAWRDPITSLSTVDYKNSYKDFWDHLNDLKVVEAAYMVEKTTPSIKENITVEIPAYGSNSGNLLLFQPVVLNRYSTEPYRYDNRTLNIEIARGFIDQDDYSIHLIDGIVVDALPNEVTLSNKFGEYHLSFDYDANLNAIQVSRYLKINEGVFDKSEYQNFKDFRSQIVKHDNSRGVLLLK